MRPPKCRPPGLVPANTVYAERKANAAASPVGVPRCQMADVECTVENRPAPGPRKARRGFVARKPRTAVMSARVIQISARSPARYGPAPPHKRNQDEKPRMFRIGRATRPALGWADLTRVSVQTSENPMTSSTERMQISRQRRRRGIVRMARVEVSENDVRALANAGRLSFAMKDGNTHINKENIKPAAEKLLAELLTGWTSEKNREHAQ